MLIKKGLIGALLTGFSINANCQVDTMPAQVSLPDSSAIATTQKTPHEIYKLCLYADIPIIAVGVGSSAYCFPKIYSKDPSTPQQIRDLNRANIPSIDRWAAGKSDKNADNLSDYFLYGSVPVPFALLLDKEIRKDAGKIGLMYIEAFSITGFFYSGSVFLVDRYRPETYNTSKPAEDRISGNYKDAFIGGHPSVVATATFFTAKVYADYHPESNFKYVLYGFAVAATGTTVYLRHLAGKHFPTDLLAGVTVGTLSGILVPQFHKTREARNKSLSLIPFSNGQQYGFAMTYRPE